MMLKSFTNPIFLVFTVAIFGFVMITAFSHPDKPNPFFVCVENTVWHIQKPVSIEDMKKVNDMCLTVVEKTSQFVPSTEGSK